MQNNDKGLRPHFRVKIQDQNGKSFDAGGIWWKEGKYGLFLTGSFNNNVQLQNGQKFMISIPDTKLKDNLSKYFNNNPEPPKIEKREYSNVQPNNNYNRNNYNNNDRGFTKLSNSIPNVNQSWQEEGEKKNVNYTRDGQIIHDEFDV